MQNLKIDICFAFAGMTLLGRAAVQDDILWGQPVGGFTAGIAFSNRVYALDEPLIVTVFVRNESETPSNLSVHPVNWFLSFAAADEKRPRLLPVKPVEGEAAGIRGLPGVPKDYVHSETVNLHDFLIITNSGQLMVTATWKLTRAKGEASSENAIITILPPDQPAITPGRGSAPRPLSDSSQLLPKE